VFKRRLALIIGICAAAVIVGTQLAKGTSGGLVLALGVVIAPLAVYATFKHPFVFPLAAYAFSVPLNDVSLFSSFGTLSRLLGTLTMIAFIVRIVLTKRFVRPPQALTAWAVLLLYMIASLTWASEPALGWPHIATLTQLVAVIAILSIVPAQRRDLEMLVAGTALGGIAAASFGLYQFAHGIGVQKDHVYLTGDQSVDPNQFAAALLLPAAVLTMGALRSGSVWRRLVCIVGDAMIVATITMSGSRGATIAIGLIIIYYFAFSPYKKALVIVTAAMCAAMIPFIGPLAARFAIAAQTGGAGRTDIWNVALAALRSNALFGAGFGNFVNAYDAHFLSVPQPRYEGWHRGSHSIFVGISVELGLAGLALFVAAITLQVAALRDVRGDDYLADFRVACGGALIAMLSASIFLDVLYTKPLWLIFAIAVVARAHALILRSAPRGNTSSETSNLQALPLTALGRRPAKSF
jgi:O-antigen ligase